MIQLKGGADGPEYEAALDLQALIQREWPAANDDSNLITIIVEAMCFGERVQEVDLFVVAHLQSPYRLQQSGGGEVPVRSFCLALEVKAHSPPKIRFEGTRLFVEYGNDNWHDASKQSEGQGVSVRRYLKRNRVAPVPFVANAIWLRNVPTSEMPGAEANLLGSDVTWRQLVDVATTRLRRDQEGRLVASMSDVAVGDAVRVLSQALVPTSLDRERLERLTEKVLVSDKRYAELLGKQLLIFRGRAGTGKTVRLTQIANDLYEEYGARVLLLTFNHALVADISRLFALRRVRSGLDSRSIRVQTVHSFLFAILTQMGVYEKDADDFFSRYSELKRLLVEWSRTDKDAPAAFARLKEVPGFNWDYVLVDEAQDWPEDERDILWQIYGPERFVIADGVDQMIRGRESTNWRPPGRDLESQVVPLRKVLRLKRGLCLFVRDLADQLGHDMKHVEPHPSVFGGRVVIVVGDILGQPDRLQAEISLARENGNAPVDLLMCVPPSLARMSGDKSLVHRRLSDLGYDVWDGTGEDRRHYPLSIEELRVTQYESCRGLEGWSVFCVAIDEFYDHKMDSYTPTPGEREQLFFDAEAAAKAAAVQWLMIPVTRAIDTLVLNVSSPYHELVPILTEVAEKHANTVEWVYL